MLRGTRLSVHNRIRTMRARVGGWEPVKDAGMLGAACDSCGVEGLQRQLHKATAAHAAPVSSRHYGVNERLYLACSWSKDHRP